MASKIRILNTDRAIMFLCKDARRRWMQYCMNRKIALSMEKCFDCKKAKPTEADHAVPLGPRPRSTEDFSRWLTKLFHGACNGLCKACHYKKTQRERNERRRYNA